MIMLTLPYPAECVEFEGARIAAVGERASKAKFTEAQVRAIRAANAAGESQRQIAFRFSVNPTSVRKICIRESWRHIA